MGDFLSTLQLQAQEYRHRMRLASESPLEVHVPNWKAVELINRYGSLQAAADTIFRPGAVKIIDRYWHDFHERARENIERRLTQFDHPRSDVNELMRIAFDAA